MSERKIKRSFQGVEWQQVKVARRSMHVHIRRRRPKQKVGEITSTELSNDEEVPGQRLLNQALKVPKHRVLADQESLWPRHHHHAWLKLDDSYTSLSGFNSSAVGESLEFVYVHSISHAMVSVADYR